MDSGFRVSLDPLGGNEVNFRAVLRAAALKWGASDAGAPDNVEAASDADGGSESDADMAAPKRQVANDYDYDDDFIDDDELVVDDHDPQAVNTVAAVVAPEEHVLFTADAPLARDQALPVVQRVDPAFYVNRGDIRSRPRIESAQKKVRARLRRQQDAGKKTSNSEGDRGGEGKQNDGGANSKSKKSSPPLPPDAASAGNTNSNKRAMRQQALTPSGKLAKASSGASGGAGANAQVTESAAKKRKKENSSSDGTVPDAVAAEVATLRETCTRLFGEKKPRLNDAELQMCLHAVFTTANKHGCARLHSDLTKDNRKMALDNELWSAMSKFLRTTRQHLENLGHALHWARREQACNRVVSELERALCAMVGNKAGSDWSSNSFGAEIDALLVKYYNARCELLEAKNQLASRTRTVKKSLRMWAGALKRVAFSQMDQVNDDLLYDALRRIDDAKVKEGKRKREAEKEMRKKRKEKNAENNGKSEGKPPSSNANKADNSATTSVAKAGMPKKIAQSLPPSLRNLASLKARPAAVTTTTPSASAAPNALNITESSKAAAKSESTRSGSAVSGSATTKRGHQFEVIEID